MRREAEPTRRRRSAMRSFTPGVLGLALLLICVPGQAAVQHKLTGSRDAEAAWSNRNTIAIAHILPDRDEQSLGLFKRYRDASGTVIGTKSLAVEQLPIEPYGTFSMNRKISSATLDVTGVPASCFTSGRAPACGSTPTITAHITWTGVGKRRTQVPVSRQCIVQFDGFLSIFNIVDVFAERRAVATGTMNRTTLSSGDLEYALLATGVFGQVFVDTSIGSAKELVRGDCEL
jgi:hypothetical protein